MTSQYVENIVQVIKGNIGGAKFENALNNLDEFIQKVADKELDNQIISLRARYKVYLRNEAKGTPTGNEDMNKIINALTQILSEVKELALEKITLKATSGLEELNERGANAIEKLEKMTKLMAESRLLELEITNANFARVFSNHERIQMENHIKKFRELLD